MVANKEKILSFLKAKNLTVKDFSALLGVDESEANKLLSGERVGYDTARKFIYFFKGEVAQHYIDWESTGVRNPLTDDNVNDKPVENEDENSNFIKENEAA